MEKGGVKLVVFNGDDFIYWKNWTCNYLWSQVVPFGRSYRKYTSSPQYLRMQPKVSCKDMRITAKPLIPLLLL
jgi:hypothetical protein